MPLYDSPVQILPVFKPKMWGRGNLAPLYERPGLEVRPRSGSKSRSGAKLGSNDVTATVLDAPETSLIGEVWITDDTSRLMSGPLAGTPLGEAVSQYGADLMGKSWKHPRFPILAKYIFTSDWLSVQVHPDDEYAATLEGAGSLGKTEMWYIVESERRARILLGARPEVTKEDLQQACRAGKSRAILEEFRPENDEAIYIPAGTVHALGPGLVLFEVQENSDFTYRLDDFGRMGLDGKPRALHLDKGLAVARLDAPSLRDLPRVVVKEPFGSRRYVLATPFFALELLNVYKAAHFEGCPERVEILSVLQGEGRVETDAGWLGYRTGETWLVPPSVKGYRLVPVEPTRLFRIYVPDLARDFDAALLAEHGISGTKVQQIRLDH